MPWIYLFLQVALLLVPAIAQATPAEGRLLARDATTMKSLTTLSTSPITSTATTKPLSILSTAPSLVYGRCQYDSQNGYYRIYKGFAREALVCVDKPTREQKEADKQDAADGKDGRCKYSYSRQSYQCPHRGFQCVDDKVCEDHRTTEERHEDELLETFDKALRQEGERRRAKKLAIVCGVIGGVLVLASVLVGLCCICRRWRRKRRESKPARERERERRERRETRAAVELERVQKKRNERKAKLDGELEESLCKGIAAARPGSLEQRDLVFQLERVRFAMAGPVPAVGVGGNGGPSGRRDAGLPEYWD